MRIAPRDCGSRGKRFAGTDLVTAVFRVAGMRVIGVERGPVEGITDGGCCAERQQHQVNAPYLRNEKILHAAEHGAENEQRLQAVARRQQQHDRPDQEAARHDQRNCAKHRRHGDALLQQKNREEDSGAVCRQRIQAVGDAEEIDGTILQISHRPRQASAGSSWAFLPAMNPWHRQRARPCMLKPPADSPPL
jgi:hypothetical protein